jgi:hypothetical protein
MPSEREWKLVFSWKAAVAQLFIAAAVGKFVSYAVSDFIHLSWLACTLWMLSTIWFVSAFSSYREESLSYFDSHSGRFQPRFQRQSRRQIFGVLATAGIVFAILGTLVQVYS